ncbi:MAG: hypothetical protein HKL80_11455, partial [Acidimicrobiales bacterium]|nr:hypothetical protein [Acidimicrobiales bacterium]
MMKPTSKFRSSAKGRKVIFSFARTLFVTLAATVLLGFATEIEPAKAATTYNFLPSGAVSGYLYTVAGGGYTIANGTPAHSAEVDPEGIVFDKSGNLYYCDQDGVRMIPAVSGVFFGMSMTAGDFYTVVNHNCDSRIAVDGSGNIFFDVSYNNGTAWGETVDMIPAATGTYFGQSMTMGTPYVIAGSTTSIGYNGDSIPATTAEIEAQVGLATDTAGDLIIGDLGRVRMVPAATGTYFGQSMNDGYIYTIGGNGTSPANCGSAASGIGGLATSAQLCVSDGAVSVDPSGNIVVAAYFNVLVIAASSGTYYGQSMTANNVYNVGGDGTAGNNGDGGPATSAEIYINWMGLSTDGGQGNIFIYQPKEIRMIPAATGTYFGYQMTAGDIYTIAGNGSLSAQAYNGVQGTSAGLGGGEYLATDPSGNLFVDGAYQIAAMPVSGTSGVPEAPTGVLPSGGTSSISLVWNPSQDNGAEVTDYKLLAYPFGSNTPIVIDTSSSSTSTSISTLTSGTTYTFEVEAVNSNGTGPASQASAPITFTTGTPGPPTSFNAAGGNQSLNLSWSPPSSIGSSSISDYMVTLYPPSGSSTTYDTASTSTTYTVSGLNSSTTYEATVTAVNTQGDGTSSPYQSATTYSVPTAPGAPAVTPVSGGESLSWSAPSNPGGGAISDYEVLVNPSGGIQYSVDTASSSTSFTVTGLTPGDIYTFEVEAVNSVGTSPVSSPSASISYGIASPPRFVQGIGGSGTVDLMWASPLYQGLTPVTDYLIVETPTNGSPTTIDTQSTSLTAMLSGVSETES